MGLELMMHRLKGVHGDLTTTSMQNSWRKNHVIY
jgi:tRNA A-37 threonylcarbamoyl transferase component Bud32